MENKDQVPILELRRLLHQIIDLRPDIGFRFRLMGEMWNPQHLIVLKVTERGIALQEQNSKKLTIIHDLTHIMEFEIDTSFQQYQPHTHYLVDTAMVSS